ncbi:MAG: plastocyanin/azurin family copper-binding protein [Actinomycetota bacterium]|nr:plastocyanin/azurin family copper-binding protein [Actinomycetota bacterium]
MTRRLTVPAALALAVALVGCSEVAPPVEYVEQVPAEKRSELTGADGGGDGQGPGGETLEFVAVDIDYSDAPQAADPGEATVELVNEGAIVHNVVIEGVSPTPIAQAQGGQTETGTVELEPGEYVYYCSIPGHREAGMEGRLEVGG